MSNKNFITKENRTKLVNELDDERMNNNMKKFNFILEDANSIKKNTKKPLQNESINKEIKKKKNSTIGEQNEYYTGVKSKDDPSFYKFENEENNFDRDIIFNQSEEENKNLPKLSESKKIISEKDMKKDKLNLLMRDSLINMQELQENIINSEIKLDPRIEMIYTRNINIDQEKNISNRSINIIGDLVNISKNINNGDIYKNENSISSNDKNLLILKDNKKFDINKLQQKIENNYLIDNIGENQFSKNGKNIVYNINKNNEIKPLSSSSKLILKMDSNEFIQKEDIREKFLKKDSNYTKNNEHIDSYGSISMNQNQKDKKEQINHDSMNKDNILLRREFDNNMIKIDNNQFEELDGNFNVKNNLGMDKYLNNSINNDRINNENDNNNKNTENINYKYDQIYNNLDNKILVNNDAHEIFGNNFVEDENDKLIRNQSKLIIIQNNIKTDYNYNEKNILSNDSSRDIFKDSIKFDTYESKMDLKKEEFFDNICHKNYYKGGDFREINMLKRKKINFFNSINDFELQEDNNNLMNLSEESIFYQNPYFQKQIFDKERAKIQEDFTPNKNELVIREKLMYFYLNPKKNSAMPKFMNISEKEKKCQQIMTLTDAKLPELINNFYDEKPLVRLRKFFFKISSYLNRFSFKIVKNPVFDNISLFIILINTLLILISDPVDPNSIANTTDDYFLYFYSFEMLLKIFAFGFILPENSYLKDLWNILDFVVIFVGWISFFIARVTGGGKIQGLAGLRTFRILRPLKTVKSIKGLRRIISTLLESMLALGDILIVLFFFFLIFAVAGVQMWQGNYLQRCQSSIYGFPLRIDISNSMCNSDKDCKIFNSNNRGERFICVKTFVNPNNNCTHFDDTLTGLITVFIIATMEGWSDFWVYTSNTFKDSFGINITIIFFYYHVLLFVGGYYLINLFLAVILTKFSEVESKINDKKNKIVSLYTILIQTFDKSELEDGENEDYGGEDEQDKLEDKEAKLKSKAGIFQYKQNEIPVSYELLSDVLLLKTYTPQELYYIKQNLIKEANNALKEYGEVIGQHKKSVRDKLSIKKKPSSGPSNPLSLIEKEKYKFKEFRAISFKRKLTNIDLGIKIERNCIPISLERTLKFFSDAIKNIKKDAEMRVKSKKLKEGATKKKTYLEIIKKKMEENKINQLNESIKSDNDDEDDLDISVSKNRNKKSKETSVKKDSITEDKKTTDEEFKRNEDHISFSMDTSDDDSLSEMNLIRERIIENTNLDSSRSKKQIIESEDKKVNNKPENMKLITKKTLIDEEKDLYNKLIVNKPDNPMFNIIKTKEEKIRKQKIDLLREQFNPEEYISKLKPTLRNKLGRGKSFLNVLKFTDETAQTYKKETVKEIKDYEDVLDEKNSIDISKHKEEPLIIDTQSDINEEEINIKNSEDDQFFDFEKISKTKEENKFTRLAKNSIFQNRKMKRNTLTLNHQDLLKISKYQNEYNENSFEGVNRINGLLHIINNDIKDDDNYIIQLAEKNSYEKNNNLNEILKNYEKSKSWNYNKNLLRGKASNKKIRSFSVKKNGFKFSGIEKNNNYTDAPLPPITKDAKKKKSFYSHFQQESVHENLTKYRKYMRYINYCMHKDFKIMDDFKVDDFIEDVMGKIDKVVEDKKKTKIEINPVKIFNNNKINLKTSSYLKYISTDPNLYELTQIMNNMKHLNHGVFARMSENTKNFRLALKNRIKNKIANMKVLILKGSTFNSSISSSYRHSEISNIRNSYENIGSVHKSKSLLSVSSVTSLNKNNLNIIEKIKKDESNKAFDDFRNFDISKKISNFFSNNKINNNSKENANRPQIKLEIDLENFDVRNRIKVIRNFDVEINSRKYKEWSVQQVMSWKEEESKYKEWNNLLQEIEETNIILWSKNSIKRVFSIIRYYLFKLSISQEFDFFIIFVVILNIFLMLIGGNLFDPVLVEQMQVANFGFTAVFMFEFVVKFIGLGPIIYFSDAFTFLDLAIIGFAILDLASSSPSGDTSAIVVDANSLNNKNVANASIVSQLSFLRVFRIFRVTRIVKVLKKIKHFRRVISGISKSVSNVSYNLLICFIFLLIFQLLGMNLLNSDPNFQTFMGSFYITFQILTMEDWNLIYYALSYTSRISLVYLITWIFLGNYVLFNLFISILLSSFEIEEQLEEELPDSMPEEFRRLELLDRGLKNAKKKKKDKENKNSNKDEKATKNSDEDDSEEETQHVDQNISTAKYSGVKKFMKQREMINLVFRDNECEHSLYMFSQTNRFRLWCMDIITLKKFDNFILLMILLSTLRLIIDTFIGGNLAEIIFDMIDIFFTGVFFVEMFLKIVSMGFVLGNGTYLKDNWNRIDFLIVCVSMIDLQGLLSKYTSGKLSNSSLNFLKVLRLLRTLRPLRFISHNVQLKIIITSLFDSIVPIANVLIIVMVILLVFSIVGINLFYDLYHTCYIEDPLKLTPFVEVKEFKQYTFQSNDEATKTCTEYGGIMDAGPTFKFSNILNALISSYVLANGEGWPAIMASYNQYNVYYGIFFISFWFIVSTFFMNLFVGIMFSSFNDAWNKENKQEIMMDPLKEQYYDFLKQIEIAVPEYSTFKKPEKGMSRFFYNIVSSPYFDNFIMFVIVCNMVTMAINYEGMTDDLKNLIDIVNLIFTGIFITECIMKLLANGIKGYFYFGWNKFDFFVVASGLLDLAITYSFNGQKIAFLKSFQIFRVLRVLRVTRVLRLIKSLRGLEKLLQTLRWSIDALMNVFILLFLIFCIFSIVGCYLFNEISYEKSPEKFENYNQYYNFDNFYNSFILCFRTATGENWPMLMVEIAFYDPNVVSASTVFLYFIFMNFITYTIMLNLFLLVTLQQYDDFHRKKTNPIEKFNEILDNFKKAWNKFSTESDEGYRIKNDSMTNFILLLEGDFNRNRNKRVDIIKKFIMDLTLLNDDQNYVYFHDVLYKMIKYEYGIDFTKKSPLLRKEEDKLVRSIKIIIDNFIKLKQFSRYKVFTLNTFNPLTTHLYFKVSFKFMKQFLVNYLDIVKENKIYSHNNPIGQEDDNNIFVKNHKLKEMNEKTNTRYSKEDENNELVAGSIKYQNLNSDQICSNINFSKQYKNSSFGINRSEYSSNKEIDNGNKKYFDSQNLSIEEFEKDDHDNQHIEENNEFGNKD